MIFGVRAVVAPYKSSTDAMLAQLDRVLIESVWLKKGDTVVLVGGQPIGRPGTTNIMKLHRVGELQ